MEKGSVSNIVATAVFLLGAFALPAGGARELVFSVGLFAISGGMTNTIAVKMLFDRIPGLIGSGVIELRFIEIRTEIKRLILEQFFDPDDLQSFVEEHKHEIDWSRYVRFGDGDGPIAAFMETNWHRFVAPEAVRPMISAQVDKMMAGSFGGFLAMVGKDTIEDIVGGFITGFADDMKARVIRESASLRLDPAEFGVELETGILVDDLRAKVDSLLEKKLDKLQPSDVKRMMEDVIRQHLGWLVVWGNVFGGLIGAVSWFAGRS